MLKFEVKRIRIISNKQDHPPYERLSVAEFKYGQPMHGPRLVGHVVAEGNAWVVVNGESGSASPTDRLEAEALEVLRQLPDCPGLYPPLLAVASGDRQPAPHPRAGRGRRRREWPTEVGWRWEVIDDCDDCGGARLVPHFAPSTEWSGMVPCPACSPAAYARTSALIADLARVTRERDALVAALDEAARFMEWLANNGVDDEDPSSLKAYTRNRARVAREAVAACTPGEGQDHGTGKRREP